MTVSALQVMLSIITIVVSLVISIGGCYIFLRVTLAKLVQNVTELKERSVELNKFKEEASSQISTIKTEVALAMQNSLAASELVTSVNELKTTMAVLATELKHYAQHGDANSRNRKSHK